MTLLDGARRTLARAVSGVSLLFRNAVSKWLPAWPRPVLGIAVIEARPASVVCRPARLHVLESGSERRSQSVPRPSAPSLPSSPLPRTGNRPLSTFPSPLAVYFWTKQGRR